MLRHRRPQGQRDGVRITCRGTTKDGSEEAKVSDLHARFETAAGVVEELKLARFRGRCEVGHYAAAAMCLRSNSIGEMKPIDV